MNVQTLKEVHSKNITDGFLDRFYSPYIFIIWFISCTHYGIKYMEIDLAFSIQILYSILASSYHTIKRKTKWDRDMHVLDNTNTNLSCLVLLDFICNVLASIVSTFFLCGFYEHYSGILAVSMWFTALGLTAILHATLHFCYKSIVRNTMRQYSSISGHP